MYTIQITNTVLFQTIHLSITKQFNSIWPTDWTLSVLPLRVRVDLGAMAIKGVLNIPKASALLEPTLFIVISRTLVGEDLPLCRDGVSVLYCPNWLGKHFCRNYRLRLLIKLEKLFQIPVLISMPMNPIQKWEFGHISKIWLVWFLC